MSEEDHPYTLTESFQWWTKKINRMAETFDSEGLRSCVNKGMELGLFEKVATDLCREIETLRDQRKPLVEEPAYPYPGKVKKHGSH